jgi:murein DD-endopeptidase MepM/ murein hydrolase activator NlpD
LATLHHLRTPTAHHRPLHRRTRTALAAGLLAGALLGSHPALAAPVDTVGEAQSVYDATAAEVEAIRTRLTAAEESLQRMTVEAEAASGAALAAQAELVTAQAAATAAATELAVARGAVEKTQDEVATLGREAYMGSDDAFGDVAVLLDADSPTEVLQQATTLELLGKERTEQLETLEVVEAQEARADRAARTAVAERDRAARAAAETEAAAKAQLAAAQQTFDAVAAEKAALETRLREAEIRLLELRGIQEAAEAWAAQQAAQQAAEQAAAQRSAARGAFAPTTGRITSCYGSRWGTLHAGIDIAAPIGTPVISPADGVVLQAGAASGFGLAVAVQHGDGTITVYGHINQHFVSVGQAVAAGQQIAEVGNRGQSSGPHLHFEVHTGGFYANRVNPAPWLAERGVSLGGGC